VGWPEGLPDGSVLGSDDGSLVGCPEGCVVGCPVGLATGTLVGMTEGWLVGCPVGLEIVGIALGMVVGRADGMIDGCPVGCPVGSPASKTRIFTGACNNPPTPRPTSCVATISSRVNMTPSCCCSSAVTKAGTLLMASATACGSMLGSIAQSGTVLMSSATISGSEAEPPRREVSLDDPCRGSTASSSSSSSSMPSSRTPCCILGIPRVLLGVFFST